MERGLPLSPLLRFDDPAQSRLGGIDPHWVLQVLAAQVTDVDGLGVCEAGSDENGCSKHENYRTHGITSSIQGTERLECYDNIAWAELQLPAYGL